MRHERPESRPLLVADALGLIPVAWRRTGFGIELEDPKPWGLPLGRVPAPRRFFLLLTDDRIPVARFGGKRLAVGAIAPPPRRGAQPCGRPLIPRPEKERTG